MKNYFLLFVSLLLLNACSSPPNTGKQDGNNIAETSLSQAIEEKDGEGNTTDYPGLEEYVGLAFYENLTQELQKFGEPNFVDSLHIENDNRIILLSLSGDMGSTVLVYDYEIGENNLIKAEADEITYISYLELGELIDEVVSIEGKSCRNSIHMMGDLETLGEEKFLDEAICLDVLYKYDLDSQQLQKEREDRFRPGSLDEFYSFFDL